MPKFPKLPATSRNGDFDDGQMRGYAQDYLNQAQQEWLTSTFQERVQPWMLETFGEAALLDTKERSHRFLEESLELVQAIGCTKGEAYALVDYTFRRPVGLAIQEVGQVMTTLAALALVAKVDMAQAAETELARNWTRVEAIRAKNAAKPKFSSLPGYAEGSCVEETPRASLLPEVVRRTPPDEIKKLADQNYNNYFHKCAADCGLDVWVKAFQQGYVTCEKKQVNPQEQRAARHPDDVAIDKFAEEMKKRMALKRAEGRGGWENPKQCSLSGLNQSGRDSWSNQRFVDAGNYAMMLFHRQTTEAEKAAELASQKSQIEDLLKFYGLEDATILVLRQAEHIEKLQKKLAEFLPQQKAFTTSRVG